MVQRPIRRMFAVSLESFLRNDINVIFWILVIFEVFANTTKLDEEPQKLIPSECAIVKCFTFKPTRDFFGAAASTAGKQHDAPRGQTITHFHLTKMQFLFHQETMNIL